MPGIPGVPPGRPLDFRGAPTLFRGADLIAILPAIRTGLAQSLSKNDPAVQAIQIGKQFTGNGGVSPADVQSPSALHVNIGLQREIARNLVLSADFAYRHFVHVPQGGGGIDLNHFTSIRGPVIPRCAGAQANDPQAICSLGPINVYEAPYRFTYKGLLLRAEKRFSHGFQVLGSYAYSSNIGTIPAQGNTGRGFNLDNWLQNSGPFEDYTNS